MGDYGKWVSRQRGNPIWLFAGGIFLMSTFWAGYKYFYTPWSKRNQLLKAETYANDLLKLEQERRLRE